MNPFEQRIGIWYQTAGWAEYIFHTLLEELDDQILKYSKNMRIIYLKNGDVIRMMPFSEDRCKGQRFTMSFVQTDCSISWMKVHFINDVIRPCTLWGPVYRADEYEDMMPYRRREL